VIPSNHGNASEFGRVWLEPDGPIVAGSQGRWFFIMDRPRRTGRHLAGTARPKRAPNLVLSPSSAGQPRDGLGIAGVAVSANQQIR
jgi:hypothetical protein